MTSQPGKKEASPDMTWTNPGVKGESEVGQDERRGEVQQETVEVVVAPCAPPGHCLNLDKSNDSSNNSSASHEETGDFVKVRSVVLFHALEGPRHVDAEANEGSDEKHAADQASLEAVPVIPVVEVGLRVRGSDLVQVT